MKSVVWDLESYDPNALLVHVCDLLSIRNDAQLARVTGVAPPVICKMRTKHVLIGASMLVTLSVLTGLDIKELRCIMGDHRKSFFSTE